MRIAEYFMRPHRIALSVAIIAAAIVANANEPLDSDQEVLFPGLQNAREAAGLPKQLQGTGDRTFQVLEVQNINGNDPFNEEQPVLNFNGQIVGSIADLLALINGDDGNDDGDDGNDNVCDPASINSASFTVNKDGVAFDKANASISFDPDTGDCTLFNSTDGDMLIFEFPVVNNSLSPFDLNPNIFRLDLFSAFAPFGAGFTLLTPAEISAAEVGNVFGDNFFVGRKVLQVRHGPTGRVFDVDFTIDVISGAAGTIQATNLAGDIADALTLVQTPVFRLTVNSITEVGV
ncbi:MAG: hypothetical protein ACPGGK_08175 [Pikeienuella sp.]